jgi:hypothetical protein
VREAVVDRGVLLSAFCAMCVGRGVLDSRARLFVRCCVVALIGLVVLGVHVNYEIEYVVEASGECASAAHVCLTLVGLFEIV